MRTTHRLLSHRLLSVVAGAAALLAVTGSTGCHKKKSDKGANPFGLGLANGGVVVADFQTLQDFLDHPTVQLLLANMTVHDGANPPDISGTYDGFGVIADSTIPGNDLGDAVTSQFCLGLPAGGVLQVRVLDPTVVEDALMSFITGEGDLFTVFTVFRSLQEHPDGGFCEIIEVNIFSGRREPDGRLVDLELGLGIVGLIGNCFPLLIDDAQISLMAASLEGPPCADPPPVPGDLDKVQVVVENFLLNGINVFDSALPGAQAAVQVDALGTGVFETDPGFALDFESIRPSTDGGDGGDGGAGIDATLMGEIVAGAFGVDETPAGESVTYLIENIVGDDIFFAPRPLNSMPPGVDIYAVVNQGVPSLDFFPYEQPFGSGLDCLCAMPPGLEPYDIGYYSYDAPGFITESEAKVDLFRVVGDGHLGRFTGPFELANGSGAVVLEAGPGVAP